MADGRPECASAHFEYFGHFVDFPLADTVIKMVKVR